jgi:secreted trypsin-like serine protease
MNNRGSYQRIPQEKIVGGTIVVPNSLPFQVSIQRRSDAGSRWAHYCGGVILDANVVITAAHCVSGYIGWNIIFFSSFLSALELIKMIEIF